MAHRGKHPDDDHYFAQQANIGERMANAASDLAFLLSRGYAEPSALQIVGNRYQLHRRQQLALKRMTATPQEVSERRARRWDGEGEPRRLAIDGYNLLIFLEAALSGGFLFEGADGCLRDLSGVHGSYHSVEETQPALDLAAAALARLPLKEICWYFDAPVSNSGRLCTLLRAMTGFENYPLAFAWQVVLVNNADTELIRLGGEGWTIVSTDAVILDNAANNFDLGRWIQERHIPEANVLRYLSEA